MNWETSDGERRCYDAAIYAPVDVGRLMTAWKQRTSPRRGCRTSRRAKVSGVPLVLWVLCTLYCRRQSSSRDVEARRLLSIAGRCQPASCRMLCCVAPPQQSPEPPTAPPEARAAPGYQPSGDSGRSSCSFAANAKRVNFIFVPPMHADVSATKKIFF